MKTIVFTLALVLAAAPALAETIEMSNLSITVIESDGDLVTYSWKVDVIAEHDHDNCLIRISCQNDDGYEITAIIEPVRIDTGESTLTKSGVMSEKTFLSIKNISAEITCN